MKKKKNRRLKDWRFIVAVCISIALLAIVAYVDNIAYPNNFWVFVFVMPALVAGMYLLFSKDWSGMIAIYVSFLIMLSFGLEDLIFYLFIWQFPASLPHLFDEPIMGGFARLIGLETVTFPSLIAIVIIGAIITFFVVWFLKKQKW